MDSAESDMNWTYEIDHEWLLQRTNSLLRMQAFAKEFFHVRTSRIC